MGTWFFGKERPTLCTVLNGASTRRKKKEIIFVVEYCTCTRYYSWKRKWKKNTQCKKQVKKQRKNKYEDNNIHCNRIVQLPCILVDCCFNLESDTIQVLYLSFLMRYASTDIFKNIGQHDFLDRHVDCVYRYITCSTFSTVLMVKGERKRI